MRKRKTLTLIICLLSINPITLNSSFFGDNTSSDNDSDSDHTDSQKIARWLEIKRMLHGYESQQTNIQARQSEQATVITWTIREANNEATPPALQRQQSFLFEPRVLFEGPHVIVEQHEEHLAFTLTLLRNESSLLVHRPSSIHLHQ